MKIKYNIPILSDREARYNSVSFLFRTNKKWMFTKLYRRSTTVINRGYDKPNRFRKDMNNWLRKECKQKNGIEPSDLEEFYNNCKTLKLDIIGTMCIPPESQDPKHFFKDLLQLNRKINLSEISMGMTNDYLDALEYKSTYLRIGTGIFGKRTK